jgi:hypothetical protein
MKAILLNSAIWALRRFVEAYIAGGLYSRIESLFDDLLSPEYEELSGETKRERVARQIGAEFSEVRSLAEAVARSFIELFWLRIKLNP